MVRGKNELIGRVEKDFAQTFAEIETKIDGAIDARKEYARGETIEIPLGKIYLNLGVNIAICEAYEAKGWKIKFREDRNSQLWADLC